MMRTQNIVRKIFEKQKNDIANEVSLGYFPYTHGEAIEVYREA